MSSAKELQEQGVKLYTQKEYEAAARTFTQAMEQYEADGQKDMAAEMQVNIGLVHRDLGERQQALDAMQEALHTFQSMNDKLRTAMTLGNMGGVYAGLGDKEQAFNCYRNAADLFDELGEKKMHGETMVAIASLQLRDGKLAAGADTYAVGLDELDDLTAGQKVLKGLIGARKKIIGS
ncbi:MAG TPA: tetratricopeptide repeat protein [Phototrophicaceae bacterium]|nr:tetratricopeptide repeat protein [Phototrophicaceae bacterium]